MSTLIKNGTVINADGIQKADVLVEEEIISKIGESLDDSAEKVIDASE